MARTKLSNPLDNLVWHLKDPRGLHDRHKFQLTVFIISISTRWSVHEIEILGKEVSLL